MIGRFNGPSGTTGGLPALIARVSGCRFLGLGAFILMTVVDCREALTGSAHPVKGRERRGRRHEETTMPKNLLYDESAPHERAGGRS